MLHWHPVRKLMHELTGLDVEKSAVFELTTYFEEQIIKVILQSKSELYKLNKLKNFQGLYQKSRIDKECIRNAIKTINSNSYFLSSERTGGKIKKEEKTKSIRKKIPRLHYE
jgi:hypothetical protein